MSRAGTAVAGLLLCVLAWEPASAARLLVVCQGGNEVRIVDPDAPAAARGIPVPRAPAAIALAPGGGAYVTHPDAGLVTRIDIERAEVTASAPVGGQPFGIVADPDGTSLYVGDWSADRVRRLDAKTFAETGRVAVGRAPAGLAIDGRRRELYSADRESGAVSVIDLATFAHVASVPAGEGPYAFDDADDPSRLRVVSVRSGELVEIDKAKRISTREPVGRMPYGVASDPRTREVVVANQQSGSLTLLLADKSVSSRTLRVGGSPEAVQIESERRRAYVTDWFADKIIIVDLDAFRVADRISVCKGPRGLALLP
ncbi:YncE family protein [Xanthobacter sediminis]|uniref:YncE family protein n=1 Tax=Xanthobacter sediminis TaxID=3119926 RepID=UPI003728BCC4